jgi:hypothetical protein
MKLRGSFVLTLIFTVALAQAAILPPTGSSPVAPDVLGTPATGPFLGTNALGQTTISGKYDEAVYADPSNTFCAGCLDFFLFVESNSSSTDSLARITLASFGSFLTDVGYTIGKGGNPGGVVPSTVDRSSNGAVVGFNFTTLTGVPPGGQTQELEIETNAKSFTTGSIQMIDSSVASVQGYAPSSVPEPGSMGLVLAGAALVGIGFIARRRPVAP